MLHATLLAFRAFVTCLSARLTRRSAAWPDAADRPVAIASGSRMESRYCAIYALWVMVDRQITYWRATRYRH